MACWRSYFVFILAINLLHFSNGSLADVQHVPGEESCELPCVDKIADRIFKHAADRYTALELSIIQKLELQLSRMEKIVEERITRMETILNERIVAKVDITRGHGYQESYHKIEKMEHNTTHLEVVKDLVLVAVKNDTQLAPESTESTSPKAEEINEIHSLSMTTPKQPDDCVQLADYEEDYGNQLIEARVGSEDKKLCVESIVTEKPSLATTGSVATSPSSIRDNNSEDSDGFVTQPSLTDKHVYNKEPEGDVEEPTTVSEISELYYSATVSNVFPPAQSITNETHTRPLSTSDKTATSETTTEKIGSSSNANNMQEVEQIVFVPEVPDSKKSEQEPLKPTVSPKKKIQPWIRTSTAKPKLVTPTGSSIATTTIDPNTYKIHFPTESPEAKGFSTPKHVPIPKPPQVFRYARTYLNGTWTIIHSRYDGSINFNRSWTEYRTSFGRLPGEYWMGLEAMHQLTKSGEYELLVVLKSFDGTAKTAMYDSFWVGSEASNYRLALGPFVGGDAGDSFSAASGQMFSTYDRDNDRSMCASCAELYHSGWWFKDCADANLNGLHVSSMVHEEKSYGTSMNWWSFNRDYQGLKEAAMLVRKRGRKLA